MTRHEEMRQQALEYHRRNPEVFEYFCKLALDLISRGFKNYSSRALIHQIRWTKDIPGQDGQSTFKINNNYSPFFGEGFSRKYPEYKDFFRTRTRPSESQYTKGRKRDTHRFV